MNDKQLVITIYPPLKNAAKELAKEFNVSLKQLIEKALVDLLKKHGKEAPIKEL